MLFYEIHCHTCVPFTAACGTLVREEYDLKRPPPHTLYRHGVLLSGS